MDKLNPPGSVEEYERLSTANLRYEGHGFDTTMVIPCPFCAAPDFHRVLIINSHEDLSREATCVHCGRSARMLITAAARGDFRGTGTDRRRRPTRVDATVAPADVP